jgi:hypothetical protein
MPAQEQAYASPPFTDITLAPGEASLPPPDDALAGGDPATIVGAAGGAGLGPCGAGPQSGQPGAAPRDEPRPPAAQRASELVVGHEASLAAEGVLLACMGSVGGSLGGGSASGSQRSRCVSQVQPEVG